MVNLSRDLFTSEDIIDKNPKVLIVFCIDNSKSMSISKDIERVNKYIKDFLKKIEQDVYQYDDTEVSIITFGDNVEELCIFKNASEALKLFNDIDCIGSETKLCEGIIKSLDIIESRVNHYASNGQKTNVILATITDGVATDFSKLEEARNKIQELFKKYNSPASVSVFLNHPNTDNEEKIRAEKILDEISYPHSKKHFTSDDVDLENLMNYISKSASKLSREGAGIAEHKNGY